MYLSGETRNSRSFTFNNVSREHVTVAGEDWTIGWRCYIRWLKNYLLQDQKNKHDETHDYEHCSAHNHTTLFLSSLCLRFQQKLIRIVLCRKWRRSVNTKGSMIKLGEGKRKNENLLQLFQALIYRCSHVCYIVIYPVNNSALFGDKKIQFISVLYLVYKKLLGWHIDSNLINHQDW